MSNIKLEHDQDTKSVELQDNARYNNNMGISRDNNEDSVLNTDDNLLFDFLVNKDKVKPEEEEEEEEQIEIEDDYSDKDSSYNQAYQESHQETHRYPENGFHQQQNLRKEKAYALFQLKKLCEKGYNASRNYTMEHELCDIQDEVSRIKKEMEIERSIRLSRQGLMLISSLIETGNTKYDPFGVDLNGWSETINANIEDYDEVFEELYEKYHHSISMSPEIKLLLMVTGSAISFHITKKMLGGGMSAPDIMSSLSSAMSGGGGSGMKGPSNDGVADVLAKMKLTERKVSMSSDSSVEQQKEVSLEKKKRGRKPKNTVLDL